MRRNDLAMSEAETLDLISSSKYAVLCLIDPDGLPYGVALDYVYKNNHLFFHGAKEGRKIGSMRINSKGCAVIIGDTVAIVS